MVLAPKTKKSDPTKILDFSLFQLSSFFRFADVDFETPKKSIKSSRTRSRRQTKNEGNRFTGAKSVQGQINRGPHPPPQLIISITGFIYASDFVGCCTKHPSRTWNGRYITFSYQKQYFRASKTFSKHNRGAWDRARTDPVLHGS